MMGRERDAASPPPIRVNPAPVLTLWAAVVAQRLGYGEETALSLASALAGIAARARAGRPASPASPAPSVMLLGREITVVTDPDGTLRAADPEGLPAPADPVRQYLARAFGARLEEARAAMQALAARLQPDELNRQGFQLFEAFRPDPPGGATGPAARSRLHLHAIRDALPG